MRYIKALVLLVVFFAVMIFLFQNQASLSQTLSFRLDLLVLPAMTSIELPFYFVLLGAFLLGAILCLLLLLWDRMRLSAAIMRANFRVQAIQNEERKLMAQMERLASAPKESRLKLLSGLKNRLKGDDKEEKPAEAETANEPEGARKAEINAFFNETSADGVESTQATEPAAQKPAAEGAKAA